MRQRDSTRTADSVLARPCIVTDKHYNGDRVATGDLAAQVSSEDPRMNLNEAADLGLLILRFAVGVVFIAHGYSHIFGGGMIAGTARWFESLGMRPGIVHAWLASLTELSAGVLLIVGLAAPLACAGVVAAMVVALITNHLKNGFFIFRPGERYEYVMTLALVGFGLGSLGPGAWSFDYVTGLFYPPGLTNRGRRLPRQCATPRGLRATAGQAMKPPLLQAKGQFCERATRSRTGRIRCRRANAERS